MSNILSFKIQLFLIITRITRKFIPENKILGITRNRYNKLYVRKLLENSIRIRAKLYTIRIIVHPKEELDYSNM